MQRRSSVACYGAVLLDLSKALRKAQKCRLTLAKLGFPNERWQEIVNDVDPDFRFMVRPKVMDAILMYLHSKRKPVTRESLIQHLNVECGGTIRRIRQSITTNLRNGKLIMNCDNKIGLPEWE